MSVVPAIAVCEGGPTFSQLIPGLMRLLEWGLTPDELVGWIETCLELGMTTFDHADIYGGYQCEAAFGRALAQKPRLRDQMQLVSKCGIMLVAEARPHNRIKHYNTTQAHIIASAENSLRMLQTDRLDLLLIHRPDPLMDVDEVAMAFDQLRAAGKVLYFGVSNFTPAQFDLLQSRLGYPLVTNQIEVSVTHMAPLHDGSIDHLYRLGRAVMAWSPLGGGRIFRSDDEVERRVAMALAEVGAELGGAGVDQVALAWLLAHPARILPVLGTGQPERLRASAFACQLRLDRQQWFRIWRASAGADVP